MPQPDQTQEEFLQDLKEPDGTSAFDQTPEQPSEKEEQGEVVEGEQPEKPNRRERRLQRKLDAERESSIFMAGRLEAMTEAQKLRAETEPSEYLKQVEKIYGTNSPEAIEATELLKNALRGVEERATNKALEMFREEQKQERDAVVKEEKTLDSMVEELEDELGVTIDAPTQKGFFQLLEKLSPKDEDGNVLAYADHFAVWDELQARKKSSPQPSRAKDLASRAMSRTGASPKVTSGDEANQRWLIDNGII